MAIKLKENFTEEFLADLKPEASAYLVADLKTPNFMCRVNPRGNKTYIYKRCINRKPVVITIGLTTEIKLKDARKRACELAAEVSVQLYKILEEAPEAVFKEYKELSFLLGKTLTVYPVIGDEKSSYKAKAVDIDENASLIVELSDGSRKSLFSGEVSLKSANF